MIDRAAQNLLSRRAFRSQQGMLVRAQDEGGAGSRDFPHQPAELPCTDPYAQGKRVIANRDITGGIESRFSVPASTAPARTVRTKRSPWTKRWPDTAFHPRRR